MTNRTASAGTLARTGLRARFHNAGVWLMIVALSQFLAACGGGGGGGGNRVPPTGTIQVTVVDDLAGPVLNADVVVTVGGTTYNSTTTSGGIATIGSVTPGSASVEVTAEGFEDGSGNASVTANQQAALSVTLIRITEPAAGLFTAQLTEQLQNFDGQTLTFSVDVLVVDDDSAPGTAIENLTSGDFTFLPCTDSDPAEVECLRGTSSTPDTGYIVVGNTSSNFELVPGQPPVPYAATLMIDQSGSIRDTDPSGARLFAAKVFMDNLGASDFASISAFAQENPTTPALIPDQPVTRLSDFIQSDTAETVFPDIDELAELEGGATPLYAALDQELAYTAANAPAGNNRRFAVVLFTDGDDSVCQPTDQPPCGVAESIQKSVDLGVDIFTVGLGDEVNVDVLRELSEGGNGFYLFAENAQQLFPIYSSLGNLLSRTLATYRMEWTIQADAANTYQAGQTLLGTMVVNTGSNEINLPVRVFLTNN
ncbi:MAG: carboxypeptidase regulatory-like domain-containing protein [Pseudomonadales bacterium]